MTPTDLIVLIAYTTAAAATAAIAALAALAIPLIKPLRLPRHTDPTDPADPATPNATIILAALNEQERIADTVRLALAQENTERVIVVDDRSTDDTPRILDELARNNPKLHVIHITELPPDWLGKTHALHTALQHAPPRDAAPFVLFIDADTHLAPGTLRAALEHATKHNADHLIGLPGYPASSTIGAAFSAAIYLFFIARSAANQLGIPRTGVGIGAFTLISREALDHVGGLERLRLEVVEDVKLGILVQRAKRKTAILNATQAVTIDWQANIKNLLDLLEKNFFAVAAYSKLRALALVTANLACYLAAVTGLPLAVTATSLHPAPRAAAVAATLALAATAIPTTYIAHIYRWPILAGPLAPLAMPAASIALINSAVKTLANNGVAWRGTHYPLKKLREMQVR